MKKQILLVLAFGIFLLTLGLVNAAQTYADVLDEVLTKSAQSNYEANLKLVHSHMGSKSGVTFESYSNAWNTTEKLKALEDELLQNKHGEELAYLGKVIIIPNRDAGISGLYRASYLYSDNYMSLDKNRIIYLFDGDNITTIEGFALTLSHEYGHHFTFYNLINREKRLPKTWKTSDYVAHRGILEDSRVDFSDSKQGDWLWRIEEIMAEDYVQLFGSELAIKQSTQRNIQLKTPFESSLQEYWSKHLTGYTPKQNVSIYLRAFDVERNNINLQLFLKDLQGKTTYLHAKESVRFNYKPVLVDMISGFNERNKSYKTFDFMSQDTHGIVLSAIQHEATGFNRGSKPLLLNYQNLSASVSTDEDSKSDLSKDSKIYSNTEIKSMLHEVALQFGIPPEILKAIAFVETGMEQYDKAGNPILSADGGIGMMQITMSEEQMKAQGIDKEKLKWNTRYNMEIGAKILKEKWNNPNLPKINDKNPAIIENWYFAIMAYNGLSKRNDPTQPQVVRPYQERVLEAIRNYGLLPISTIPNVTINFSYTEAPDIMTFPVSEYRWPNVGTKSAQMWEKGQTVYTLNNQLAFSKLRDGVNGAEVMQLPHYTPLEIVSGPFEVNAYQNHFVMYEVRYSNDTKGFIASSNLRQGNQTIFPNLPIGELASAVAYLQVHDLLSVKVGGSFNPNQPILRREAAAMLVKELGLTLPAGYVMKASDMKPSDEGYQEMMIAEAHGILGKDGTIRPNGHLTRAQMAAILVRAYDKLYAQPTTSVSFTDVPATNWSYNDINTLAFNRITVTAGGAFRPNGDVTNSQFALLLMRTIGLR